MPHYNPAHRSTKIILYPPMSYSHPSPDYIPQEYTKKYNFLNSNNGISENTNEAIKMATGDFIGFLDHDDIIPKEALFEIVKVINVTLNFFDII